jgi:hypothetical protein
VLQSLLRCPLSRSLCASWIQDSFHLPPGFLFTCSPFWALKTVVYSTDFTNNVLFCIKTQGICDSVTIAGQVSSGSPIKSGNLLLGTGKRGNVVYVTERRLATHLCLRNENIEPRDPIKTFQPASTGTCRYASIYGHLGWVSDRNRLSRIIC